MKILTASDCNVTVTEIGHWVKVYVRSKDFSFLSATKFGNQSQSREAIIAALTLTALRSINQTLKRLEEWLNTPPAE